MNSPFAETPRSAYYIVAFSSQRTEGDNGYSQMAADMEELALLQPGCLECESVRDFSGIGITNSFWKDEASIKAWKANVEHQLAKKMGRNIFYQRYIIRIAKVERDYSFERS